MGGLVSLRRVNFRFWSHLGCSGQNTIIFSRKGLHSKGCTRGNMNKLYIFNPFYLLDSGNKSLNKGWATPRLVSFRGLIQNFRRASPPLLYGSLPLEYCYGRGRSAPDCKTVVFSHKIRLAQRSSLTRAKLSVFSLAPDHLFDSSRVNEYAKRRTVFLSKSTHVILHVMVCSSSMFYVCFLFQTHCLVLSSSSLLYGRTKHKYLQS